MPDNYVPTHTPQEIDKGIDDAYAEAERAKDSEHNIIEKLGDHKRDKNNPHGITKSQLGLDQVDNTSDANKPISTETREALVTLGETLRLLAAKVQRIVDYGTIYQAGEGITIDNINDTISVAQEVLDEIDSKQDALSQIQLNAVNSGITAEKVNEFEGKQNALSQVQLDAANSGITAAKVEGYDGLQGQINNKQNTIDNAHKLSASLVDGLGAVATSNNYNDLTNKPDLTIYEEKVDLATVAESGSYDDLLDKPDLTVYAEKSDLGTAAEANVGTGAGDIPAIGQDGKLPTSVMPAITIKNTFVVNTEAAMLALTAQTGDMCIRTDLSKSYVLTTDDPTLVANWQELLTPPNAVLSVNGQVGTVELGKGDIGLGDVANTGDSDTPVEDGTDKFTTGGAYAMQQLLAGQISNIPVVSIVQTVIAGSASATEETDTDITIDGVTTQIKSFTKMDTALSPSSKNPVTNQVIYNAISNKANAEDVQELEQIALTTLGIKTGTVLTPVSSITDGNYYPTVVDNGNRWNLQKADSPTFFKIYDVSQYSTIHLKAISRAGHILTNSLPADFITRIHQNPTQVATWKEYPEASGVPAGTNSEQAEAQPRSGYIPYDKDLLTNGKQYLIVYEGNAAQAIEVTFGGGYSPIPTSMFQNDGDGTTQNDPYAKVSQTKLSSALTASVTVGGITSGDSWPAGTSIETILRALLDPQQP